MNVFKVLILIFLFFILFSCVNKNKNYKINDKKENTSNSFINSERIVLKTLSDIKKINELTRILIINEEFWKNEYVNIMKKILKYDFNEGPLLINIIGNGNIKYYKISQDEAKLLKKVKSKILVFLYNNGKNKGIIFCDRNIKQILGDKDYICGN